MVLRYVPIASRKYEEQAVPRLIDDLRAARRVEAPFWIDPLRGRQWDKHAKRVIEEIRTCPDLPVLLIDNVAEYYYSGSDQEYWNLGDHFPNLAPPYPVFWTEHKIPKRIVSREFGTTEMNYIGPRARTGILWVAATEFEGENIPANSKWALTAEIYIDYDVHGRDIEASGGTWIFLIDADGLLIGNPVMQGFSAPRWNKELSSFINWMHPALLAVSFMHCRNVKLIDNAVDPPLAKKYHQRTGIWPTSYHTLEIEPLKQILRREGGSDKVGVAKAMHICRGHFKDYRQGAGLFGKYHQLVWQPSVIRGTKGDQAPPREIKIKLPKDNDAISKDWAHRCDKV